MNTVLDLFRNLWNATGCIRELLDYLLRFLSVFFRSRASLAARLVAAESQLGICKRRIDQKSQFKPRFTAGFRLLWVVLSELWTPWRTSTRHQLLQRARWSFSGGQAVLDEIFGRDGYDIAWHRCCDFKRWQRRSFFMLRI